jgi:L-ascorbate metabolism protein UlaG (beta-lactamase superfamily)
MREEGVAPEQLMPMNKGGSIEYKGVKVSFTHAQHSSSYDTSKGPVYAGEACGVVLSAGRYSIYHAGDTAMFSDMELIGELYRPYIALLPIGDCFTMGPAHAARAAKFIGCRIAIPIHHKTFDALTGTAEMFRKECSRFDIEVVELLPGEALSISPQTAARAA